MDPNKWRGVCIYHPLVFKQHPLEDASMYVHSTLQYNHQTLSHSCLLFCKPSLPTHLPPPSKNLSSQVCWSPSPLRTICVCEIPAVSVVSCTHRWSMGDPGGQWEIPLVMGCLNCHGGAIWHLICVHICLGGWNFLPCYFRGLFWTSSHQQKKIHPPKQKHPKQPGPFGPFFFQNTHPEITWNSRNDLSSHLLTYDTNHLL